ncbi:MAG: isoleucine--tRNA ligase [Candidatus Pacebacteria bacterium]|nr:isoleucine--tRNA ligase [Candidatus Paceibacterota bacterium]
MPKVTDFNQTPNLVELEEAVQKYWQDNKTFEKSVEMRDKKNSYVFYDGPPFATGLPHYGHILASTMKDVVPRYWTMQGKRVERKWGWDCHGLPIENIAEKELGISQKKEIEELGVEKFNEVCRSKVLSYVDDWKTIIRRLGRWADMENDYKTMDIEFMESVWWVFKELHNNGLIYEDHRSMHICPRCETTLSQSEVTEGYKDIKDISVVAKFKLKETDNLYFSGDTYVLAWTTTPWTLPGNFLLAVNEEMTYILFKDKESGDHLIAAKDRLEFVSKDKEVEVVKEISGADLIGLEYQPLFDYYQDTLNAFRVVNGEFVSNEDGTGIVHIAPGFGDDDYKLGKTENVELIQHVGMNGRFRKEVTDFAGLEVKPKDNHQATDIEIIKYLAHHDRLWSKLKITHSYPHCWRCDTPLLNYATGSYFVNVTKIKDDLLENAKKINWSPDHIKEGRWGNWLKGARDWSISRQRFWASVIPIWKCDCGYEKVYGSASDLEKDSGEKVTDLHKHVVDQITVPCEKCDGTMKRVPDVLDTWFDSGSMPYGQAHYPFEDKAEFERNFPAEFIGEGVDQTRAWFYYLHVIACGVKKSIAFKNVIVNGIVLAEDGKKMSKRLQNYPDPVLLINKYGADSLRMYLTSSPVLKAENLNFSEREVSDLRRKVFIIWWNVFSFYQGFVDTKVDFRKVPKKPDHILDQWLLARLAELIDGVTENMNNYDLVKSSRLLIDFIADLSNWYLRLSRNRLKDNKQASHVLGHTLYTLAQLFAPFTPFFSETIHQTMADENSSIHHTDWPQSEHYQKLSDTELVSQMDQTKKITEQAHSLRRSEQIKVRQPLASLTVSGPELSNSENLSELLMNELNVKNVNWQISDNDLRVEFDLVITPELKEEGEARELMRNIQKLRKEAGLNVDEIITIACPNWSEKWQSEIEGHTSSKLVIGEKLEIRS